MRNMSFSKTTQQVRDRTKTVTRRLGWWFLKPGDRVRAVEKAMGLKKGEKVQELAVIEIVDVYPVVLDKPSRRDVVKEGFPEMTPEQFVRMFCRAFGCKPWARVNRIRFRYVDCQCCGDVSGEVGQHPPDDEVLGDLERCPDCGLEVCPVCLCEGHCCAKPQAAGKVSG